MVAPGVSEVPDDGSGDADPDLAKSKEVLGTVVSKDAAFQATE